MVDLKKLSPKIIWYIIGFIATDGHLSKDGRHINITSKDKSHLEKIKRGLKIANVITSKSRGRLKEKDYFCIQIGDVKLYKYLLGIGFVQKKSLKLGKIKVDRIHFSDFLRGVIDGDGCISTWVHKSNQHQQWSLRITSAAQEFIEWLKEEAEDFYKIRGKLYDYRYQNKKNKIYILKFGKLATKIIIENVYYKNSFCLERKNKTAKKCLQDKDKMINYNNVKARVL